MSKIHKPNSIIFIGANLYKDFVQRAYLERIYPYIKDANHIDKYPIFKEDILENIIKNIKEKEDDNPIALFVLDKYCNEVYDFLDKKAYEYIEKDSTRVYIINKTNLIIKCINIFEKLPTITNFINRNISDFKLFGKSDALEILEDKIKEHGVVKEVLPTWYNIEIKDSEGEEILTKLSQELNIKVLPVRSVRAFLLKHLAKKGKKLSIAESCTGGLLVAKLIAISGASEVIEGTMVTYSNRIKHEWLGVKLETLEKFGAVSKECVKEMLLGIKQKANSDIAVAISGIAGPTGGTEEKPVGTVYIGVMNEDKIDIKKFQFNGDRRFIQELAARSAIEMIIYSEEDIFDNF